MLADLFHLDPRYYHIYNADNPGEQFALTEELADRNRESLASAFTMDRHTWKEDVKSLDMRFYIATFLGENGETDLEVYYGLPIYDIIKKVPEERTEIQLENGLAIHDADWHPIAEQVRQTTIPFNRQNVKKNDLFLDLFRTTVKPGSYQVAIHARPENTNLLATSYKLHVRAVFR